MGLETSWGGESAQVSRFPFPVCFDLSETVRDLFLMMVSPSAVTIFLGHRFNFVCLIKPLRYVNRVPHCRQLYAFSPCKKKSKVKKVKEPSVRKSNTRSTWTSLRDCCRETMEWGKFYPNKVIQIGGVK